MVGERPPSSDLYYGWWFAGSGDAPYFGATDVCLGLAERQSPGGAQESFREGTINDPGNIHRWHFWSMHTVGSHFLFADGTSRMILYGVGQPAMNAAATTKGDEPNTLP
jgi:hypothetical protein